MVLASITVAVVNASNQTIWQAKVAPDVQGRVFSARRLIAWFTNPITPIIGGTLADFVLGTGHENAQRPGEQFSARSSGPAPDPGWGCCFPSAVWA